LLQLMAMATASWAASNGPQTVFATPDDAANALLDALASGDYSLFLAVAGPQMAQFWVAGDPEKDPCDRERFAEAARRNGIQTDNATENRRTLYAVSVAQPFPAPLVKTDSGWRFDDDAGSRELAARRIRRNEIAVIELCLRFREAEYTYFGMFTGGAQAFAARIRSTPGQHDGLFWSELGAEDESPLGPPFAAAAYAERQAADGTQPLFGYYFKILPAQGPDAGGGVLDYRTKGQLRKGFALIAWPAEYGADGTQSFLLNHFGDIYQKDLGADTARIAEGMAAFNPDRSWRRINDLD